MELENLKKKVLAEVQYDDYEKMYLKYIGSSFFGNYIKGVDFFNKENIELNKYSANDTSLILVCGLLWLRVTGRKNNVFSSKKVLKDHITVDEAQDFSEVNLYVIKEFVKPELKSITLAGDLNQKLNESHTLRNWGTDVDEGSSLTMIEGFRNTKKIAEFLIDFIKSKGSHKYEEHIVPRNKEAGEGVDVLIEPNEDKQIEKIEELLQTAIEKRKIMYAEKTAELETQIFTKKLEKEIKADKDKLSIVMIFFNTHELNEFYRKYNKSLKHRMKIIGKEEDIIDFLKLDKIMLVDINLIKGLEADTVFVMNMSKISKPNPAYVALSRAKRHIYVIDSKLPELLAGVEGWGYIEKEEIVKIIEVPKELPLCPNCNMTMKERVGKFGKFYGCSYFPNCKGTRNIYYK